MDAPGKRRQRMFNDSVHRAEGRYGEFEDLEGKLREELVFYRI